MPDMFEKITLEHNENIIGTYKITIENCLMNYKGKEVICDLIYHVAKINSDLSVDLLYPIDDGDGLKLSTVIIK